MGVCMGLSWTDVAFKPHPRGARKAVSRDSRAETLGASAPTLSFGVSLGTLAQASAFLLGVAALAGERSGHAGRNSA